MNSERVWHRSGTGVAPEWHRVAELKILRSRGSPHLSAGPIHHRSEKLNTLEKRGLPPGTFGILAADLPVSGKRRADN